MRQLTIAIGEQTYSDLLAFTHELATRHAEPGAAPATISPELVALIIIAGRLDRWRRNDTIESEAPR